MDASQHTDLRIVAMTSIPPRGLDPEIDRALVDVRRAYREGRGPGERALFALEELLLKKLSELREQAMAVADANVHAIEIVEAQREIAARLDAHNRELAEQNQRIDAQRATLEGQVDAMATANVDAVLMLDEHESRLQELSAARARLSDASKLLRSRADELEAEALALAESNANAVLMIDEREEQLLSAAQAAKVLEVERGELEQKAFVDSMTGLFNHRYFKEQAHYELARAHRYRRALSLVFIDVDHFKNLNDTHGHPVGDQVLAAVGRIVSDEVRAADITVRLDGAPFAVRYGGEEFVVILPETDLEGAALVAERLRARVEATDLPGGETQPSGRITISAGVATLTIDDADLETVVCRADEALYAAKQGGRNRVVVAD